VTLNFGVGQSELPWGLGGVAAIADVTRVCQEVKTLGANSIRMSALWIQIDPNRDHNYQWANLDRAISAAVAAGLEILLIIEPRRSVLPIGVSATTALARDFGLMCGAIAQRYTGAISFMEIGNEVNNMAFFGAPKTPSKYLNFLREAFTNIMAADPAVIVLAGALQAVATGWPTLHPVQWVEAFYDCNPQEWFHGLSMHPYSTDGKFNPVAPTPDNEYAFKNIDAIRAIMNAHGDSAKKIFCTEWGYDSMRSLTGMSTTPAQLEAEQAVNMETHWNILKTYADSGAIYDTTWVFMYRDWEQPDKKAQNHFGMVHFDYTQKPESSFFRNLAAPWSGVVTDAVGITDSATFNLVPAAFPAADLIGIIDSATFEIPAGDVEWVSTGAGDRDTTTSLETILTWTHVVTAVTDAALAAGLVVSTSHLKAWDLYNTLTVTSSLDGALTRSGSRHISASSTKKGSVHGFALANPDGSPIRPTVGTHTLTAHVKLNNDFTTNLTAVAGNSVLYHNVGRFDGTVYSNGSAAGGNTPSVTANSAVGNKVLFVFGGDDDFSTAFNQTTRYQAGSTVVGDGDWALIGDADGANTVTGTASIGLTQYGGLAFDLVHGGTGSVGGSGPGAPPPPPAPGPAGFVTLAADGTLALDGRRARFHGANMGGSLGLGEDDTGADNYGGTNVGGLHLATHAEIDAALDSAVAMNANLIRSFAVMCFGTPLSLMPTLGSYNDANFEPFDYAVQQCGLRGIKLILPLVDQYNFFMGGRSDWCSLSGVSTSTNGIAFFTNATVIANFKAFVSHVLNHVNSYTGIALKNDPVVLAWETGNELTVYPTAWPYSAWTDTISRHIKLTEGAQQLVVDGKIDSVYKSDGVIDTASMVLPYIDIHSTHGNSEFREPKEVQKQAAIAKTYNKAFLVGEMSSTGTPAGSSSLLPWTLPEMLTQISASQDIDAAAYWQLLAPLTTHGDGWTMHWPGDDAAMVVRGNQFKDHASFVNGGGFARVFAAVSAGVSQNSSRTRTAAFNASMWLPVENDQVWLIGTSTSATATITVPAGWVNPLGGNTVISSDAHTMFALYHLVTAAEAAAAKTTYPATSVFNSSGSGYAIAVVLRGGDPVDPIDAVATAFNSADAATPHVLPGLTGVSDGSIVISCVTNDGLKSYTDPIGWGRLRQASTNQGAWLGVRNAYTTAGEALGGTDIVPSAPDEYCSISVAIKPPAPGS
jgi:hypothetical protein